MTDQFLKYSYHNNIVRNLIKQCGTELFGVTIALFFICFLASALGNVVGFGGGIIIKPFVDMLGFLPVSTLSFLSGCTVLSMSISSLIRSRSNGISLDTSTITPLALGSALGGVAGKLIFDSLKSAFSNDNLVGALQSLLLLSTTIGVLIYTLKRNHLNSLHLKNPVICGIVGLALGLISSFLGIGGGPVNIAVLFFLFSMDIKTAAKNSIYIILFSQTTSLLFTLISGTVPFFSPISLIVMCLGGIGGAQAGDKLARYLSLHQTEVFLYLLISLVIVMNIYNSVRFLCAM